MFVAIDGATQYTVCAYDNIDPCLLPLTVQHMGEVKKWFGGLATLRTDSDNVDPLWCLQVVEKLMSISSDYWFTFMNIDASASIPMDTPYTPNTPESAGEYIPQQCLYGSLKTWNFMEFDNSVFPAWKVTEFV